mmetsp:Transcript_41400/g.54431  ORF Transcript_41400/g.54431 Transcript_41400/m.54431 type:complete len:451 (+) Transcript_41400:94-1446(+)
MEFLQIIGISIAILFTIWVLFYTMFLGLNMRAEPLRTRNPVLLFVSSVGVLLNGITMILHACSTPIPCYLLNGIRRDALSLVVMPGVLRGMQYIVLIHEGYRRRFPRFKSSAFSVVCNFAFVMFHAGVGNILSHFDGAADNDCFPPKVLVTYITFVAICLIFVTIKIFRLIPWEFDEYHIAEDLKQCSIIWAVGVIIITILITVSAFLDKKTLGSILLAWMLFLLGAGTFLITVVRPIHVFIFNNNRSRWYVNDKKDRMMINRYRIRKIHVGSECGYQKTARKSIVYLLRATVQSLSRQLEVIGMVLEKPEAIKKLHDFSNRRLFAEVTLFMERANNYKRLWMVDSVEESLIKSTSIVEDFIKASAHHSINISGKLRNAMLKSATDFRSGEDYEAKFPRDFFDECYDEMCKLFFSNLANDDANDNEFWLICIELFDIEALKVAGVLEFAH